MSSLEFLHSLGDNIDKHLSEYLSDKIRARNSETTMEERLRVNNYNNSKIDMQLKITFFCSILSYFFFFIFLLIIATGRIA